MCMGGGGGVGGEEGGLCRTFTLPVAPCNRDLIYSNVGCRGLPSAFFLFFRLDLAAAWLPTLSDQALQQGALAGIGSPKHKALHQHAFQCTPASKYY